jgi:thiosulfate reductase cytochrome b subunit
MNRFQILLSRSTFNFNLRCYLHKGVDGKWQTAFLPVFRISKRLARDVLEGLRAGRVRQIMLVSSWDVI